MNIRGIRRTASMRRKERMKNIQHEIQEVEKIIRLHDKIKDDTFFGRSLLPEMYMLTRKRNILEERYKILEEHENKRRLEEERLANVDFSVMKKSKAVRKQPESPDPKEAELQGLIKGCPQPNPGFMIRFKLSTAIKALKVQETTIDKVQVGRIVGHAEKRVPLTSSRARCYQTDKQLENIQKLLQNQRTDRCICKSPERQKKIRRATIKDAWQEEASYVVSEMSHVAHDRSSEPCFNCVDNEPNRPNTVQGLSSIPHFLNMDRPSKKVSVSDSHQVSASAEESGQLVEEEDRPTCRYIYKHGQCSSTKNPHLLLRRPFNKAKDAPAVGTIEILGGHDNSGFVSEDGFCPFCEYSPRGHVQRWLAAQQTGATKGIYGNPPRHKKKRRDLDAELDRRWTMLWAARGSTPFS